MCISGTWETVPKLGRRWRVKKSNNVGLNVGVYRGFNASNSLQLLSQCSPLYSCEMLRLPIAAAFTYTKLACRTGRAIQSVAIH